MDVEPLGRDDLARVNVLVRGCVRGRCPGDDHIRRKLVAICNWEQIKGDVHLLFLRGGVEDVAGDDGAVDGESLDPDRGPGQRVQEDDLVEADGLTRPRKLGALEKSVRSFLTLQRDFGGDGLACPRHERVPGVQEERRDVLEDVGLQEVLSPKVPQFGGLLTRYFHPKGNIFVGVLHHSESSPQRHAY